MVQRAGRDNLGLCLDTFQTAGNEWADPTAESGRIPNADAVYRESLAQLTASVPKDKIFFFQVS